MKHLIVNADDFGLAGGVNRGILEAFQRGGLGSATLMATGEAFDDAAALAALNPGLGVGVHLALVGVRPVSPPDRIPSLVDASGRLWPTLETFLGRWVTRRIRREDVTREIEAQIEKILAAGIQPTHLDTHKHTMVLPGVMALLADSCRRLGVPAVRFPFAADRLGWSTAVPGRRGELLRQWCLGRAVLVWWGPWRAALGDGLRHPERFYGVARTGLWTRPYLESLLETLPDGVSELMTHPGRLDESLKNSRTRLKESRQAELELLCDVVPPLAARHGIRIDSYRILAADKGDHHESN